MEPLIELPSNELWKLKALCTLPENVVALCMLDMFIKYPGLVEEFGFKVYCPEGNLYNGMIAISSKDNYYQVVIQSIKANISKIKDMLLKTKLIDWNRDITVPSASEEVIECLEAVKDKLGVNVHYSVASRAYKHFRDVKSSKFDIILPPNTYIRPLKAEHIDPVNKTWTYYSEHSYCFFQRLKDYNLIHALYSKFDDSPMAWVTIDNFGGLTHLYCLVEHRKKGYAEVITKYAVNSLLDNGQNVLAYTLENNTNPKRLFDKLNFENVGCDNWVIVSKKK